MSLTAPFPWFGGKRRVAHVVWRAFGPTVPNYVEPFAGSLAVLLGRPVTGKIETVNDRDRYLANFWRAVRAAPDEVARHADWPVNEADMHARHKWLVGQAEFRERMHTDPDFYDPKIAGWWVWGICIWIGGGWCVEPNNRKHPKLDGIGKGVHSAAGHRKRPDLDATRHGRGVHSEEHRKLFSGDSRRGVHADGAHPSAWRPRPHMSGTVAGQGVHAPDPKRQMPMLAVTENVAAGRGVHSASAYSPGRRPDMSSSGQGVHLPSLGNDRGLNALEAPPCLEWFRALQRRLRRVRVACGDWRRVLGPSVLGKGKNVGGRRPCAVFLDPPYSHELRDPYLYSEDDARISEQVGEWAREHGSDPDLRIALCGYEGEHDLPGWKVYKWKAARGYAAEGNENRQLERIWFSPACLPLGLQGELFGEDDDG